MDDTIDDRQRDDSRQQKSTGVSERVAMTLCSVSMITIDNLVDDVLRVIADFLLLRPQNHATLASGSRDPKPGDGLRHFASVCRRWRAVCLPLIFRETHHKPLSGLRMTRVLPSSIWVHIRVLHLDLWVSGNTSQILSVPPARIVDACNQTLPPFSSLPNVHTVIFNNAPVGIWPALLNKVILGPSLKALEWRNSPWRSLEHKALSSVTHYPPLRRISYEVQKPYQFLYRANLDAASEEAALYSIFQHVSAHVEHLALPGETANFGMMAALNWSSLRELILVGRAPDHEKPLIVLLENLVGLRVLDLQISFIPALFVWPPEFELCSTDADAGRGLLPRLETLSLTNADPTDLILQHIPSTVTTLCLIPHPKSFVTRFDGVLLTGLSPNIAMKADDIITILTKNDVSSLTTLRISVHDTLAIKLFSTISNACPGLETLEVFRRRSSSPEQEDESCSEIGSALSSLSRLHTLRIAFDFTDAPERLSRLVTHNDFDYRPFWETCLQRAKDIATHAGPGLQQLSFSKRRAEKGFWFNYDIQRSGQCLEVLERDRECEYT